MDGLVRWRARCQIMSAEAETLKHRPRSGRSTLRHSRINRARFVNPRARFVLRTDRSLKPRPWRSLLLLLLLLLLLPAILLKILIRPWGPSENGDWRPNVDRLIERDRQLFRHSHATV